MKVKLVKQGDRWVLYNEDGSKIASSAPNPMGKLSIKNCQAIERGYDLDELIDKYCRGNSKIEDDFIKKGFQKALEILGDKKFSEEDMKSIFEYGWNQRHYDVMDETKLERIKNR